MAAEKKEKVKTRKPTAQKRDEQDQRRRLANRQFQAGVRTEVKKLREMAAKGDKEALTTQLNLVYSLFDKGVKRGTYKLNAASRSKSRLAAIAAK